MIASNGCTWKMWDLPSKVCKTNSLLKKINPNKDILKEIDVNEEWISQYDLGSHLLTANVDMLRDTTKANGGGTFKAISSYTRIPRNMRFQSYDMSIPTEGYCVATHPELGTWIPADATEEEIACYIETFLTRNAELLQQNEQLYFGTWVSDDPETEGMISLDISSIIPSKEAAMTLGKMHDQQAIFDLSTFESIPCGGSGTSFTGKVSLEPEIAENYIKLCCEYLERSLDEDNISLEDVLTEKFLKENLQPSNYGFEFADINNRLHNKYDDSIVFLKPDIRRIHELGGLPLIKKSKMQRTLPTDDMNIEKPKEIDYEKQ